MKYKTSELANIAGVSSRLLRYYDEIGLLSPKRDKESNYRFYDTHDVDMLQQILLFKEMGVALSEIKQIIENCSNEDRIKFLKKHLIDLKDRQNKLDKIINTVNQTIKYLKGEIIMNDKNKFEGLKEKLINENDKAYKDEVISRYGKENYEKSRNAFKKMSEQEFNYFQELGTKIIENLKEIKKDNENIELKIKVAKMHKEWITIAWGFYDKEIHFNVVNMYVEDERFKNYYDSHEEGIAAILRDIVHRYLD